MPIGQRGIKKVKTVRVLTDADPRRVSLVENGANQTPFREIKTAVKDNGDITSIEKENMMPTEVATKSGAELVKVTFSKAKFASTDDVKKWLSEKGYAEPTSIEDSEAEFTVVSPEFATAKQEDMRVVEAEDGVSYVIAKGDGADASVSTKAADEGAADGGVAADEDVDDEPVDDDEDDSEGDVSDEVVKAAKEALESDKKESSEKVNAMRVYYSEKQSMKDVLKEGDDGMPIGISDLYGLFSKALENAARSGDTAAVKAVSAEFGTMFTEMMDMTNKFIAQAKSDGTKDTTAKSADEPQVSAEEIASVAKSEEEKTANRLKEVQSTLEEQVAKAATLAQDNLNTAIKSITDVVGELTTQVKALTERISELESVEQTRKGADDEMTKPKQQTSKSLSVLEKNILGIR